MGQKINPTGFRLPVTRNWTSRWYANGRDYPNTLQEDLKVRSFLLKKLRNASVARVLIERPANNARITMPGRDVKIVMRALTSKRSRLKFRR